MEKIKEKKKKHQNAKIDRSSQENPLLATCEKHVGPVQGLDFNPFVQHLLASGGSDSEVRLFIENKQKWAVFFVKNMTMDCFIFEIQIFIWDLQNPLKPTAYSPGAKLQNQQESGVMAVAWNKKVQHILASSIYSGVTSIWDLRAKRAVLQFSDPSKKLRCRAIAWNPEEPTQILTASEDDSTPVMQIWDLKSNHPKNKKKSHIQLIQLKKKNAKHKNIRCFFTS